MKIDVEAVQEGYIVVPHSSGYNIFKLINIESGMSCSAFGDFKYWFSGEATYAATVNTERCTTPEEIVALIEEQEKRNGRERVNYGADQD